MMSFSKLPLPSGRHYASSFQLQSRAGVCRTAICIEVSPLTAVSSHTCRFSIVGFDGEPDDLQNSDSALTTLQTNQINAARAVGIPTESISGSTTAAERRRIENDLKCGHPYTRLLYITPELLAKQAFRKVLTTIHQQGQLIRVAIDEAHCIR